ncbi:SBBP repeat-containing protein [Sporosarcina sp. FSL K6-3457]|uniref:SBBP repeat-containing protein n=1 Tax=Sporosarcina sp. FSL K6-3457 TaxID=2978204 RepID=UPI0030F92DAE
MTSNGNGDAFVTKLNPTGTALVYSTYLGGTELDQGLGIAVDNAGNAYVTGDTLSANFPTTPGAFQTTFNAFTDAFVTKLNPMGTQLVYSTYLGGSDYDSTTGIIVDNVGNAYVTGYTSSTDFPTTPGAFDTTYKGDGDAFVTKLNPTGSKLVYSTYLGGTDLDQGLGIAVDNAGNVYVTGATQSADFPTTTCAFDTTFNGVIDAFVTKLNPAGTALLYSTYLGGSDFNQGYAIAVDNAHNAYVTGLTMSTDFPTSPNAFDTTFNGVQDAFVTKFNIPPAQPFYLGVSLTKDVQVQSDATLSVQGHFCEPRIPHQTTDLSLQKENDIGCIRAKRVHDWVVFGTEHQQKGFIPVGLTSQILDCQNVNSTITVLCEAIPGSSSFSILDDTKLTHEIPEAHLVMIRFTVLVRLQYFCNGTPLCDFEVPVTTVDRVILCYPEGTSIVAKVSAVECLVVGENC